MEIDDVNWEQFLDPDRIEAMLVVRPFTQDHITVEWAQLGDDAESCLRAMLVFAQQSLDDLLSQEK